MHQLRELRLQQDLPDHQTARSGREHYLERVGKESLSMIFASLSQLTPQMTNISTDTQKRIFYKCPYLLFERGISV